MRYRLPPRGRKGDRELDSPSDGDRQDNQDSSRRAPQSIQHTGTQSLRILPPGRTLADEPKVRPETIQDAVREIVRLGASLDLSDFVGTLARGRYAQDFRNEAEKAFMGPAPDFLNAASSLAWAAWYQTIGSEEIGRYPRTAGAVSGAS